MALSRVVRRYFDAWISHDTWDSYHLLDSERFYRFVKAAARYSRRKTPWPRDVKAGILTPWRRRRPAAALNRTADRFVALYQTLLEYEKTRGFPDPLIERTDIVQYHLALTSTSRPNHAHEDRVMAEVWGKRWQETLNKALGVTR